MDRSEFLKKIGIGAVAAACVHCLSGCTPEDQVIAPPTNVDFTLDLTAPANNALNTSGGYIYNGGIIVARTVSGAYVALSMACTHAGTTVYYDAGSNRFNCPSHGSIFATDGAVVQGPAGSPLAKYKTTLSGTSLRVYS